MLTSTLSPRKVGNEKLENEKPNERPHYIGNPFQNVQPPDALRSPSKQMLKPLMLCQSSAEEQMACLLLSNGTWTPSGVPAAPGPPGRGLASGGGGGPPMQMQGMSDSGGGPIGLGGNNFRPQGQRGRGLAMQQRRFQQRPLESDRVDNWRQRPGPSAAPPPGVGGPGSFASNNNQISPFEGPNNDNNNNSQQLWQSRQAESRLAPNWLMGSNSQPSQPANIPSPDGGAVSPFQEPLSATYSAPKPSNFESIAQSEAGKLFAEDIAPYWTSGKPPQQQQQSQQQPQQQPPVTKSPAASPPAIIDGESLWNTLSAHELQPPPQQQPKPKTLSPISSDPAVLLARKAVDLPAPAPASTTVSSVERIAAKPPVVEQQPAPAAPPPQEQDQAWFYVDPSGTLQGPFSGQQMEEWDNEGYFPDDLRLRPAVLGENSAPTDERGFITLSKLRASAVQSGKPPFLACNISPRQLTPRDLVETKQQQQQQQPVRVAQQVIESPRQQQQQQEVAPPPDIRRQSWGSSLSSISSDADVPLAKPAVSRIAVALTSNNEPATAAAPLGWGEEAEEEEEEEQEAEPVSVVADRPKSKTGQQQSKNQQQQQGEKSGSRSRRRKKSSNKAPERDKEQPMDPLLNAEPAEVRRARMAAEQLRIAEENSRKLEDRDAMLAILEEKRVLREKEREMERRMMAASQARAAAHSGSRAPQQQQQGPPALPSTAKWAVAAKQGARPTSLLEIQRQEEAAEMSERQQEEQRRVLAHAIAASTQQVASNWSNAPAVSSQHQQQQSAPWASSAFPAVESSRSRKVGGGSGFWDEGDDDAPPLTSPSYAQPQSHPQQQQQQTSSSRAAPKLSNILGSSGATGQSGKSGGKQKDTSKPSLAPEMSVLASWVVSELSRRYSASTSLSPDIVPAFARLLGTIDEVSGQDELLQRAAPYFYRQDEARAFVADFIAARTRLQQNPSLLQASAAAAPSPSKKQQQPNRPTQQQSQQQQQQDGSAPKSKSKKKPIPVSASALFRLVGPPPPAPQLDE